MLWSHEQQHTTLDIAFYEDSDLMSSLNRDVSVFCHISCNSRHNMFYRSLLVASGSLLLWYQLA